MKLSIYLTSIVAILLFVPANAQVGTYSQLLVNKYNISPAYAGFTSNKELFLNYRRDWNGIANAPQDRAINFNSPFLGKSGYGIFVKSSTLGIFNYLSAGLSYSYDISINENNHILFGTSLAYFNNNMKVDYSNEFIANDPRIYEYQDENESYINSSFGIVYARKNLNVGVTLPNLGALYNKNLKTTSNYNALKAHITYAYPVNQKIELRGLGLVENYTSGEWIYSINALCNYNQLAWGGLSYRNPSVIGFIAGVNPANYVLIQYSYETSSQGIAGTSSGNHEITLGILFGRNKNARYRKSGFGNRSKEPYNDWIK